MEKNVSICMPVYNGAKWLKGSLASAVACTCALEIIVCDDGSTDGSPDIVREFAAKDPRIQLHSNKENLGLVGNWNKCLELASGEWIKFLFQDDQLQPGSVERMLKAATPAVQIIAARRNFVFTENCSKEARDYFTNKVLTLSNVAPGIEQFTSGQIAALASKYIGRNFIGEPSTIMFRRSVINEIGKFDPVFKQICDLEYWLRIATKYGLTYVPDAIVDFTVHDESESARNSATRNAGLDAIRLVDRLLHAGTYAKMRSALSAREHRRLKLWLRVQTYECRVKTPDVAQKLFMGSPHLERISEKIGNGLLYWLVRMRRR